MIDKTNIPIDSKNTKKIQYNLSLDEGFWYKQEYDSRGNEIYYEDSDGYWFKRQFDTRGKRIYFETIYGRWSKYEYNNEGDLIYYEDNEGIISDDR